MQVELTEAECNLIAKLCDIAVRAEGLIVAEAAVLVVRKIRDAVEQQKLNALSATESF
jgi:hypothetical protein